MFTKKEYQSKGELTAEVTTSERFNNRTGDVDQKIEASFYNKKLEEIGWVRVVKHGDHTKILGDTDLAELFNLIA